ncbi:MAG: 7-cyano-7-deazaguanine synthase QueC [Thermodesulfobacteriota bacterium]
MRDHSIVLLSGGLDSTVTAAIALQQGPAAFLHVNYGQRTWKREEKAFNDIADYYGVSERLVVNMEYMKDIGGSALTDASIDVPAGDLSREGLPVTYVPFRNAHLLSIAVSWAEVRGALGGIYAGAVEEDSSGYPDCRVEFFRAFNHAVELGTGRGSGIEIKTPLIEKKKSEIVRLGLKLKAPLELTWSCYKSSVEACGECDSCLLRLRGFLEAGSVDPIPYATHRTHS